MVYGMGNLKCGRGLHNTRWRAACWEPMAWMVTTVIPFFISAVLESFHC